MANEVRDYVEKVQDRACLLCGVIEAVNFIENEGGCVNGRVTLNVIAEELAREVFQALDRVNLPEVKA